MFWAWLSSRVLVWAFVMMGHVLRPMTAFRGTDEGSWVGVSSFWLNPWTAFDSRHYIGIAQTGYTVPIRAAFFPLYPYLMRALVGPSANENIMALCGILISHVAFAGALWLLFCLTRDEWGDDVAKRAVWIEAFFPMTAFSAAVYTESLFLLLSIGFFYAARRKQWWLCAPLGLLSGLTRNSGAVLCLALLLDRPKTPLSLKEKLSRALCAVCPLVALLGVQWWIRSQLGSSSLSIQTIFGRRPTFPVIPLWLDISSLFTKPSAWLDFVTFPVVVAGIGTFVLIWVYRRRFSAGKLVFVGGILLASLTLSWLGEPHTVSTLRYLFGAFPAAQLFALASSEKFPSGRANMYLVTALLTLFFAHSYLFGLKSFLG